MANFSETAEAEIEVVSNSEEIYTALLTPPGESEDHYQELKPTGEALKLIHLQVTFFEKGTKITPPNSHPKI